MREQMQMEALNAFLDDRVKQVLAGDADNGSIVTILSRMNNPATLEGCFNAIRIY